LIRSTAKSAAADRRAEPVVAGEETGSHAGCINGILWVLSTCRYCGGTMLPVVAEEKEVTLVVQCDDPPASELRILQRHPLSTCRMISL
jgi:hypothetical protein